MLSLRKKHQGAKRKRLEYAGGKSLDRMELHPTGKMSASFLETYNEKCSFNYNEKAKEIILKTV